MYLSLSLLFSDSFLQLCRPFLSTLAIALTFVIFVLFGSYHFPAKRRRNGNPSVRRFTLRRLCLLLYLIFVIIIIRRTSAEKLRQPTRNFRKTNAYFNLALNAQCVSAPFLRFILSLVLVFWICHYCYCYYYLVTYCVEKFTFQ